MKLKVFSTKEFSKKWKHARSQVNVISSSVAENQALPR